MDALLTDYEIAELNAWFDSLKGNTMERNTTPVTFEHSPAMRVYCSLMCLIGNELSETTLKRNDGLFADKSETVIHIILHYTKGEGLCSWYCDNGKFISADVLDELVSEKLLTKRASKARGMYSNPVYIRNF